MVAVAANEQTCVYGRADAGLGQTRAWGNKRAKVSLVEPQKDTPPRKSLGPERAFCGGKQGSFLFLASNCSYGSSVWSCVERAEVDLTTERIRLAKMESKVAASLAGCSAFELNRL